MEYNGRSYIHYLLIGTMWTAVIFLLLFAFSFMQNVSYDKSISIYSWTDLIDPALVAQFEKETGIKVYMSYFENNKELLVKLQATRGRGYDLIIPSDYIVQELVKEKLIKPLAPDKVTILDRIHPSLVHRPFDPKGEYVIPYCWSVYGLAIDTSFFGGMPESSWNLLFEQVGDKPYSVVMINEPKEAVSIAAQYLFGTVNGLAEPQLKKIQQLLKQQKKMVEVYADALGEYYMLAHMCPVVLSNAPVTWRMMKKNPDVAFVLPREGSFMILDCFALSAATQKDDLIYTFINYIYKQEHIAHHLKKFTFFPATVDIKEQLEAAGVSQTMIDAYTVSSSQHDLFTSIISEERLQRMWLSVKSF
jgi:spermidine/putrescine transport system substrate-binding protein